VTYICRVRPLGCCSRFVRSTAPAMHPPPPCPTPWLARSMPATWGTIYWQVSFASSSNINDDDDDGGCVSPSANPESVWAFNFRAHILMPPFNPPSSSTHAAFPSFINFVWGRFRCTLLSTKEQVVEVPPPLPPPPIFPSQMCTHTILRQTSSPSLPSFHIRQVLGLSRLG
jgi:hypothetical protein